MFSYDAFGLHILSEIQLPELDRRLDPDSTARNGETVYIRRGTFERPDEAGDTVWYCADDRMYLSFEAGEFRLHDGTEILVDAAPDTDEETLRLFVLGPALNGILCQRLPLVLHASTVMIDEDAVAFIGPSGQGKSTMAAACVRHGHRILSDDVAAIRFREGEPFVLPGFSASKLSPEASETLDGSSRTFRSTRTENRSVRHHHRVSQDLPSDPVPLKRLYLLEEGDTIEITPLPPKERLTEVLGNTFAPVQQSEIKSPDDYFQQCSRIADAVPITRLARPLSFDVLPSVVGRIEADLAGVS
jgi:hypothetical protein